MELLRRESNVREENLNLLSGTLEVNFFPLKFINPSQQSDLPKLSESLKNLNDDRQEVDEAITKKFQTELVNLREIVDQERAEREESEKTIQEMLKSVFSKVKEDIELERHNRY